MTAPTSLPDFPVTTHTAPLAVDFTPPLLNPAPGGLFTATTWTEVGAGEPARHLHGVDFRPVGNYGGGGAFGVWEGSWCDHPQPGQLKTGTRPTGLDPFYPVTVWAYDSCDLTEPSRNEVEARAAQVLRLEEQVAVERELAARLLLDAAELPGGIGTATDLTAAVAHLEGAAALTNTTVYFHVGAQWVSQDPNKLFTRSGTTWTSPLGNVWIVGGGYVDGLEDHIVATSAPYGWRDEPQVRTAIDERANTFAAVAERTVLVGYEALVAAVEIVP